MRARCSWLLLYMLNGESSVCGIKGPCIFNLCGSALLHDWNTPLKNYICEKKSQKNTNI